MSSAINRLITLTKMQAKAILRKKKVLTKNRRIVSIIVRTVIVIATLWIIYAIFSLLRSYGINIVDENLLTFVIVFIQIISIISCTAGLMNSLFLSNDNPILLSFPAKANEIFVSKLSVYYIQEFVRNMYFLIPFLFAYGFFTGVVPSYYIMVIFFIIILPLIPVLIGALLSFPVMYLKKLFSNKNIIQGIIFLIVVTVVLYFYIRLLATIPTPLRILANYGKFSDMLYAGFKAVYRNGLFYVWISNILLWSSFFKSLLFMSLVMLGLVLLIIAITMPTYFKLASHGLEFNDKKPKIYKNKVIKSTYLTFLKKEIKLNIRNLGKLFNDYIFLFIFPFIMFFLSYVFDSMNINNFGKRLVIGFLISVGLMITTASNSASATAISMEGGEFTLLKTAPSDTRNMAWAKITVNLAFSILVISINMILLMAFSHINKITLLLIWIVIVLVNSGHIFWAFQLDLMSPKLTDVASNGHITDTKNIDQALIIGFSIALILGVFVILLLLDDFYTGWIRILMIAAGFFALRLYLFSRRLKVYFLEIEY